MACGLPRCLREGAGVTAEPEVVAGGNEISMVSPPSAPGACADFGTVRVGDRLNDGESQSVAAVVAGTGAGQSLEGLEETLELLRRDGWASVRDRHEGAAVSRPRADLDTSAGRVVANRVV